MPPLNPSRDRSFAAVRRAALTALLLLSGLPLRASPGVEAASRVDFSALLHLAELYDSMLAAGLGKVHERWQGVYREIALVDIEATENRYFVGTGWGQQHQVVMIRGTANLTNLRLDFKIDPHFNERLGIVLHRGFEETALTIYADLVPYLDRDSSLTLSGMSLGGAAAVILGMLLSADGYRVREIVTFGQPKVTDAQGVRKYGHLPVLRVVDRLDLVPRLPPPSVEDPAVQGFEHLGDEVLLLDCEYYCYVPQAVANGPQMARYWDEWEGTDALPALLDHVIYSYLNRLRPKVERAVEIPFEPRELFRDIDCQE
ncbi:MAG: lipase family protein [Spirochaetales bacterium]|nr:lipase family protein [Spirochaetales bacterium]